MTPVLFGQRLAFNSYGFVETIVLLIVLWGVWAVFTTWVTMSPKVAGTLNIVIGCAVAIVAIRFLFALLF